MLNTTHILLLVSIKINKNNHEKGLTLIEVMVSLAMVTFIILLGSRVSVNAVDDNKKSYIRMLMVQEILSQENRLTALPFDSPEITDGYHSIHKDIFDLAWTVKGTGETLKRIDLAISYRKSTKKSCIYISRIIHKKTQKEAKND